MTKSLNIVGFLAAVLISFATAHAAEPKSFSKPDLALAKLYQDSQYLGLAQGDHSTFQVFAALDRLLEAHGLDPALKFIAIEDYSTEVAEFAKASVAPPAAAPTLEELNTLAKKKYQQSFVDRLIVHRVQVLNQSRKSDPLLIIPVDSLRASRISFFLRGETEEFKNLSGLLELPRTLWMYATSSLREDLTATIFMDVLNRYPARKAIITYHQAHLLKNLTAVGTNRKSIDEKAVAERAPLGWADRVSGLSPVFKNGFKVALFDQETEENPEGVLKRTKLVRAETTLKNFAYFPDASDFSEVKPFSPTGFLGRYRGKSIEATPNVPFADLIISTSEPTYP